MYVLCYKACGLDTRIDQTKMKQPVAIVVITLYNKKNEVGGPLGWTREIRRVYIDACD